MAYQSKKTGEQVERILDEALLKSEQVLSTKEITQVKSNLGILSVDLPQEVFDRMYDEGTLDPSVTYNTYEE